MKRLNKTAAELAVKNGLHGGTDITGFSLLGHAWEMAEASGVGLRFYFDRIPFTSGAKRYAREWIFPGGSSDNRLYFGEHVHFPAQFDEAWQMLLFDAQTSGGLLLAVPSGVLNSFLQQAAALEQPAWVVGEVTAGNDIQVLEA